MSPGTSCSLSLGQTVEDRNADLAVGSRWRTGLVVMLFGLALVGVALAFGG
ncbi:MAG TPA: hypothetical protein VGI22_23615 [Xanthobacteraceae bacterium]